MKPETKDRLRKASVVLHDVSWKHGDDCKHRYCEGGEYCESREGGSCDCYVAELNELAEAIDEAVAEAS